MIFSEGNFMLSHMYRTSIESGKAFQNSPLAPFLKNIWCLCFECPEAKISKKLKIISFTPTTPTKSTQHAFYKKKIKK